MKTKTNFLATATFMVALIDGLGQQPKITKQPTDQSVSLGASAKFQVSATSTNPPIYDQWQFAAADLAGKTNSSLNLFTDPAATNYPERFYRVSVP